MKLHNQFKVHTQLTSNCRLYIIKASTARRVFDHFTVLIHFQLKFKPSCSLCSDSWLFSIHHVDIYYPRGLLRLPRPHAKGQHLSCLPKRERERERQRDRERERGEWGGTTTREYLEDIGTHLTVLRADAPFCYLLWHKQHHSWVSSQTSSKTAWRDPNITRSGATCQLRGKHQYLENRHVSCNINLSPGYVILNGNKTHPLLMHSVNKPRKTQLGKPRLWQILALQTDRMIEGRLD